MMMNNLWSQRVFGLLLILLSVFSCRICEGDATFAVIGIPAGLALIFTKKELTGGSYDDEREN